MALTVVHKAFDMPRRPGWIVTACGVDAHPTKVTNEYDTELCNRIEAIAEGHGWQGVTCKRCLRSAPKPHRKKI